MYDVIVENLDDIFKEEVQERAKTARAARLSQQAYDTALAHELAKDEEDRVKIRPMDFKISHSSIGIQDLVFRVITYEHIPTAPGRKKTPRSVADRYVKLNFCPFKHYIIEDNVAVEVGRSHSKNGVFSLDHGRLTDTLGKMFKLLVDKYSQRSNWRGYSYIDEMRGHALLQLSQWALQFDEYRSDNPFAYYTASMSTGFTRVLNLEKRNQDIRDDLLIASGASPSFTRQLEIEDEIRKLREDALSN
jgi:ribosomal protein L17